MEITDDLGIDQILRLPQICILMTAESALKTGRNRESASLYSALHAQYPQEKNVVLGLSQALLLLGDLGEGSRILKDYTQRRGVDAEVITNLAMITLEEGDIMTSGIHYRMAAKLAPKTFATHYNLGRYLQIHGDLNEAISEFDICLEIVPSAIEAIIAKAETLKSNGEEKKSRKLYVDTLQGNKANKEQSIALIKPLLAETIRQAEFNTCKQFLRQVSNEIRSDFRIRSILYDLPDELQNEFGDGASLYDPRTLVVSKSFTNDQEYLEIIKNHILSDKSLIENRPEKPTRGGRQTHEIMESNENELALLKKGLKNELINYAYNLPESIKTPDQSRFRISGWGVSLASSGYQIRHSHPEAIASGVLYVSIPSDMSSRQNDKQGSLYFSSRIEGPDQKSLHIKPENGVLVMFPSYMPHETIPFESAQKRICIAVNLIPIRSK